ncbi:hypothetical protein GH714_035595 [Hevea brasiliensis]|uniref:Uncharacterized protein n=1 Tax=Hevea brasiliensis TaxID=3981 RepID=A0A6A6KKC5_HEVBR|nr:hypothetical protein GH714_035595 [Hevea brasiliensis]
MFNQKDIMGEVFKWKPSKTSSSVAPEVTKQSTETPLVPMSKDWPILIQDPEPTANGAKGGGRGFRWAFIEFDDNDNPIPKVRGSDMQVTRDGLSVGPVVATGLQATLEVMEDQSSIVPMAELPYPLNS